MSASNKTPHPRIRSSYGAGASLVQTPVGERKNPVTYMKLFGQLARAHGLKVVEAPALDLCSVSGTLLPRKSGATCPQWFSRVNIPTADQFFKSMQAAGY